MDISKIDKNFAKKDCKIEGDKITYSIPSKPFSMYGVSYLEYTKDKSIGNVFMRMPYEVGEKTSEGVEWLNTNTAGGRLRFKSDAKYIEISVEYGGLSRMSNMCFFGSCGFVLIDETNEKDKKFMHVFGPQTNDENGYKDSFPLSGEMRDYILYFPCYQTVNSLKIAFNKEAQVLEGKKYKDVLPILYYGSSITQGGCPSRTDNAYQSLISKWNNVDFINLGFSGNAKAEDNIVDYLTTIDCSVFVCDYDHNAPSSEYLKDTHYKLYKRYRAVKKDTPILFISKPDTDLYYKEADERYDIIKETYIKAKKEGDKNVYLLDGHKIFGKFDRENCTVDGCHPNDLGFYRMAKLVYKTLKRINKKLK